VAGAGFDFVDAFDGAEIDGIDSEAVEGVGGEGDDLAAAEAGDDVVDERGLGLVGMDTKGFGRQCGLLLAGRHPLIIAQSLPSMRLRFELRGQIELLSCKVFQAKKLTLPGMGLFLMPAFILVDKTGGK
jgi:hypothetical protein